MEEKPCGKNTYTKQAARDALTFIRNLAKKKVHHRRRREDRIYHCRKCNGWHLTSEKRKKKQINKLIKRKRQELYEKDTESYRHDVYDKRDQQLALEARSRRSRRR